MNERPDDICPRPPAVDQGVTRPHNTPVYFSSVWECENTGQARELLEGEQSGYVYQRDAHPNADVLADLCGRLHGSDHVAITSSGMAALSLALLSQAASGDHVVVSNQLYGQSEWLLANEAQRFGISSTLVDSTDLEAVKAAVTSQTRLLVVETISNPMLRVADLAGLAEIAHEAGALLLVDNTFATPVLCQPLAHGADLVMESISKIMNGHGDVMLGLLAGSESCWDRVPTVLAGWGFTSGPMNSWLATRGLATLHLRISRAVTNAQTVAQFLAEQLAAGLIEDVQYPGLESHPDHALACQQLSGGFGHMISFRLAGDADTADQFLAAAESLAFCPSLGEATTTLSHPMSTSHRRLTSDQQQQLGISAGTIRLSVGIESAEFILDALAKGLAAVK